MEALGNGINCLGQGRGHRSDGFLGATILVRKQLHQRQGVELIQARTALVALLGEQVAAVA